MRHVLIALCIAASLLFSVGGVAMQGRAGDANAAAPDQCRAPVPMREMRIPAAAFPADAEVIVLNTRGYNYAAPGEEQMDPTGRTPLQPQRPPAPKAAPAGR